MLASGLEWVFRDCQSLEEVVEQHLAPRVAVPLSCEHYILA